MILILGYTSWTGAFHRARVQREDRLTLELIGSDRIRCLLVSNPFRSLPVKLVRRLAGPPEAAFPASETRRLHEPVRLRRKDPKRIAAIRRSCAAYERSVRRAAAEMDLQAPAVLTTHPLIAGFGGFEWAGPVTYHATDDMTAFPPMEPWAPAFRAAFEQIRAAGRRTIAVTPAALRNVRPEVGAVIPNGIEPREWIGVAAAPAWFLDLPRPRFLYVGALDERIDVRAVRSVAEAWPGGTVALVGPGGGTPGIAALGELPNVRVHPRVDRQDFPGLLGAADVGMIPHVRTALTRAMSPLKLYEYLAAGLPVAAVDLPGIAGVCPQRTCLAPGAEEFASAVRVALDLPAWPESERLVFLARNAWASRFEQMLDIALAPSS